MKFITMTNFSYKKLTMNFIESLKKINLEEDQPPINFSVSGIETNHNIVYNLHDGANLISYIGIDSMSIGDAIPDNVEAGIEAIIGQGVAASPNPILGWVGSLSEFTLGKGYWLKINPDILSIDLVWNSDNNRSKSMSNKKIKYPSKFQFNQSSLQAFYFVNAFTSNTFTLDDNDIILSYCNGIIAGSRYYNNENTDIPVMGEDGEKTLGYCNQNDIPTFKLFDNESGRMINLETDGTPPFEN